MNERGKSHKRKYDFEGSYNQRKQFGDYHNESHGDYFKHQERKDFKHQKKKVRNMTNHNWGGNSKDHFTQVSEPKKVRKFTVSFAVPASILDETSAKDELRTYVVGQIARAATIYSIDEIIVFDDYYSSKSSSEGKKTSKVALEMMKMLLEYQELPQYLRKYFFGFQKHLRFVALLNPLNSPHHLKQNEWCEYRDGVVLEESKHNLSYADIGLSRNVILDQKLKSGIRVTVKLPPVAPNNFCNSSKDIFASVVSPDEPRTKGYYWGYSVRAAKSISEVVSGCTYPDGYDLIIGTSDKGDDARKIKYPKFSHALILFGGVEGLEMAIEADPQLHTVDPKELFHYYVNTCCLQQARTIRTEEAVLISLCVLQDKLYSS